MQESIDYRDKFSKLRLETKQKVSEWEKNYSGQLFKGLEWGSQFEIWNPTTEVQEQTLGEEKIKVLEDLKTFTKVVEHKTGKGPQVAGSSATLSNTKFDLGVYEMLAEKNWWQEDLPSSPSCLFIMDYPLEDEAEKKNPFISQRGSLLFKMIKAMKLGDEEFGLTYLSSNEDDFFSSEMNLELIKSDIYTTKPQFVITLGARAFHYFSKKKERLSIIHGRSFDACLEDFSFSIIPLFHPDYLMINPNMKKTAWEDMQGIMKELGK